MEVDHKVRLADGGADTDDNKWGLCTSCHAEKTMKEQLATGNLSARGMASTLSPDILRLFTHEDAKPPQFSMTVPNLPDVAASQRYGFDVNRCRESALTKCSRKLPVFCVADSLVALNGYEPGYDFYFVESHKRLVWCEAVGIYLQIGTIAPQTSKLAQRLRATSNQLLWTRSSRKSKT